jgi:cyclic pyranopterin phosphate synthase
VAAEDRCSYPEDVVDFFVFVVVNQKRKLALSRKTMVEFSHFGPGGESRMVDVGDKPVNARSARASGCVRMSATTLERIRHQGFTKGNVLEVARLAGIMAAKRTGDLIPLCHPLSLEAVEVDFEFLDSTTLSISAGVRTTAKTGVEMEALMAVAVAGLTVYDMCKSADRSMVIGEIQLEEKTGGRSGTFQRGASGAQD